jgi:hypothetical protein
MRKRINHALDDKTRGYVFKREAPFVNDKWKSSSEDATSCVSGQDPLTALVCKVMNHLIP